jgi:hypothetical protein
MIKWSIGDLIKVQTMDKHNSQKISRFIILIPHKDSRKLLDEYRARLFSRGFTGAYSFPAAAPLAELSRPFDREELRELASNIRNLTREKDGRISSAGTAMISGSEAGAFSFFGLYVDLSIGEADFPETAKSKILHTYFSPVLCAALVNSETNQFFEDSSFKETPALSFRAASLANLAIRPIKEGEPSYSFEWKMSPAVWLPSQRKAGKET